MKNAENVARVHTHTHTHTHTGSLLKIIKINIIEKDGNIMLTLV